MRNFESLVAAPAVLQHVNASKEIQKPRVDVVTTAGGGSAIMLDQLAIRCVTIAGLSEELVADMVAARQDSGEFNLIVFVIGLSAHLSKTPTSTTCSNSLGAPVSTSSSTCSIFPVPPPASCASPSVDAWDSSMR
ncbi:hypothetical protein ACVH9Z_27885 [Rhodococcus opacus]